MFLGGGVRVDFHSGMDHTRALDLYYILYIYINIYNIYIYKYIIIYI